MIAYLPWLRIADVYKVGAVRFHPWQNTTAQGLTALAGELAWIHDMYREATGHILGESVLLSVDDGRPVPQELTDADPPTVMRAVHLLFMALLEEQQKQTSFGPDYMNGTVCDLYFHRYEPGSSFCSITTKRMGSLATNTIDMREVHYTRPRIVAPQVRPTLPTPVRLPLHPEQALETRFTLPPNC